MQLNENTKPIAEGLLQLHLDGKLKGPRDVLGIAMEHQPSSGLTNQEWTDLCAFILSIEHANNIPAAKKVAEEHGLNLRY